MPKLVSHMSNTMQPKGELKTSTCHGGHHVVIGFTIDILFVLNILIIGTASVVILSIQPHGTRLPKQA